MKNILTYAQEILDTFAVQPFSPVDSLILSWISYYHLPSETRGWKGVRLAELFRAECFEEMFRDVWDIPSSRELLTAMAASPRYRNIQVLGYLERLDVEEEMQFAAVSFQIDPQMCYVAFRGTDATLVGWKEDFNMAFQYPVPSQEEAARYLAEAARYCTGQIRTGGHSKGGNLAVYAAANSEAPVKERIVRIYSHDGPGFLESTLESPEFRSVEERIDKTLPQSSVVGMLLEQQEQYRIVKSRGFSFWQHDPFSWVVEGNDFQPVDTLTYNARHTDQVLNQWIRTLSPEERARFVDALYALVGAGNASTISQLRADWKTSVPAIAHAAAEMDEEIREFLTQTVKTLVAMNLKSFPEREMTGNREKSEKVPKIGEMGIKRKKSVDTDFPIL
ncbi:MAG: DUF2974 domain-containing protein [Clostridiales bacterium]|nr:DUF2974 domain-containing protein [Clostridiales bacterium]